MRIMSQIAIVAGTTNPATHPVPQNSSSYVTLEDVPYGGGGPWALTLWAKPGSLYGPGFEYLFSHNQSAPSPDVLPNQVRACSAS